MGWQDAPVVSAGGGGGTPAWQSAPVVGGGPRPPRGEDTSSREAFLGTDLPPQATKPPPGFMDKLKGAGEALFTAASGAVAAPASQVAGVGRTLTSGQFGKPEGIRQGQETAQNVQQAMTYQPRTESGKGIIQGAGELMDASKLAGLNPAQGMAAGGIPRPPVMGAVRDVAGKAGRAIADSPEGFAVKRGVEKAGAAMRPEMDTQTAELARKAQAMGLKISPDMLSDNKFMKMAGQASRDVPASGSQTAGNRESFNRMIIKSFGGDEKATKISPKVFNEAMTRHGEAIGDISAKNPIPYPDLKSKVAEIAANAQNFETADVSKIINSYARELDSLGAAKGQIDGVAMRKLRTKLTGQMRRAEAGDLKHALSEIDDAMLDAIQGQLSPQELKAFDTARRFYANGKRVEPLIAKAASKGQGDMSPAALAGRVTATGGDKTAVARGRGGELADISAVGTRFMTEPRSSGTAERGLVYGGLLGGGAMVEPHTAAGLYGLANLYNRLGPLIARGMIPKPP